MSRESGSDFAPENTSPFRERVQLVRWPLITMIVIGLNVLVFAIMAATGAGWMDPDSDVLIRWGANFPPRTTHGEWWRIVTSGFVHIGVIHLGMNMVALWLVGRSIETRLGRAGFTIVYLLSNAAGALLGTLAHPDIVSAGASGSVLGLYGALLGFTILNRELLGGETRQGLQRQVVNVLAYSLVFGLSKQGIDNTAHFGGAASGFLMGMLLSGPMGTSSIRRRVRINTVIAIGGVAAAVGAAPFIPKATNIAAEADAAERRMNAAIDIYNGVLDKIPPKNTTPMREEERIVTVRVLPEMIASIETLRTLPLPAEAENARSETLSSWRNALSEAKLQAAIFLYWITVDDYNRGLDKQINDDHIDRLISTITTKLREIQSLLRGLTEIGDASSNKAANMRTFASEWEVSLKLRLQASTTMDHSEADRLMRLAAQHDKKRAAAIAAATK